MSGALLLATVLAGASPGTVPPAAPAPATSSISPSAVPTAPAQGPDVELHVPRAEIKKVDLDVENLQARLDVDTRVANLVQISAGVTATVGKLKVQLEDVAAETHLVVRLDRVAEVMSRALATIDQHPDLAGPGVPRAGAAPVAADTAASPSSLTTPAAPSAPAGTTSGAMP